MDVNVVTVAGLHFYLKLLEIILMLR